MVKIVSNFFKHKDSVYPDNKLIPTDPFERATHHMLIDSFQRVAGFLFKALKFKDAEAFNEIYKILDSYEKFLSSDYFGGQNPGITDVNKSIFSKYFK